MRRAGRRPRSARASAKPSTSGIMARSAPGETARRVAAASQRGKRGRARCRPPRASSASWSASPRGCARLVALSSTTSTRRSCRSADRRRRRCGARRLERRSRATKWNRLPCPTSLSTQMRPPISSTSCDEIARPRPVPPYRRVVEASACTNAPKICHCLSGGNADAGVGHRELQHGLVVGQRCLDATSTTTSPAR